MKFACDECGRAYSVSDELRGKTFKMKCKACGHLIVVRGSVTGVEGDEPLTPSEEHRLAEPARPADDADEVALERQPLPSAVDALEPGGGDAAQPEESFEAAPEAVRPSDGYIELTLDEAGGQPSRASSPPPLGAARASGRAEPPRDAAGDPFSGWNVDEPGSGDADGIDLRPPPLRERTPEAPRHVPPATLFRSAEPDRPRSKGIVVALAGGVLLLSGISAYAILRGGEPAGPAPTAAGPSAPAPSPAPSAAGRAPAPAPVPPAVPAATPTPAPAAAPASPAPSIASRSPAAEPPKAAPQPKPEPTRERRQPERTHRKERSASAERRTPPPRPVAFAEEPRPPEAPPPISPEKVARIVSANERAFQSCIASAKDSGLDLAGRSVTLLVTVAPSGSVNYPTLDDVELSKTDLGDCLKKAARLMVFPKFDGDPMKVEVPLTLGK